VDILTWWTVPQTARWLGVSTGTTYIAIARGRLQVVETPLGVLVDPASAKEYARTRRPVRHKGDKVAATC